VDQGQVTLCVSAEILAEVRDVLTRPKTQLKFPGLTAEWVEAFVKNVELKAVLLATVPHAVAFEQDPKDEPYLNLAVAVHADYLVTRDLDLLHLIKDKSFRQRYPALQILDPPAFLEQLSRRSSPEEGSPRQGEQRPKQ